MQGGRAAVPGHKMEDEEGEVVSLLATSPSASGMDALERFCQGVKGGDFLRLTEAKNTTRPLTKSRCPDGWAGGCGDGFAGGPGGGSAPGPMLSRVAGKCIGLHFRGRMVQDGWKGNFRACVMGGAGLDWKSNRFRNGK